jgi:hypothetical protein
VKVDHELVISPDPSIPHVVKVAHDISARAGSWQAQEQAQEQAKATKRCAPVKGERVCTVCMELAGHPTRIDETVAGQQRTASTHHPVLMQNRLE